MGMDPMWTRDTVISVLTSLGFYPWSRQQEDRGVLVAQAGPPLFF